MDREVMRRLAGTGLLMLQDQALPSVAALVADEVIHGSWWAHPKAHAIFAMDRKLAGHPDVLSTKLIARKVTFVHRRLWPALLSVATSRAPWQTRELSPQARRLLARTDTEGAVVSSGAPVKELEWRLLVRTEEQHTETGAHRIAVEPWTSWAARVQCRPARSVDAAIQTLEKAVGALGGSASLLPWRRRVSHRVTARRRSG